MKTILALSLIAAGITQAFTPSKPAREAIHPVKHQAIYDMISREVDKITLNPNVKNLCNYDIKLCMKNMMYKMVEFESGYNTNATYKENFTDAQGKNVISRGLFQLSVESANGYKCNVTANSLHDMETNTRCAVKIMHHWLSKDLIMMSESKNIGGGRYWSVCRPFVKDKYGKTIPNKNYLAIKGSLK